MYRSLVLSGLFLLSLSAQAKLTVHEWGTFTSLVGSNGQAQNGMFEEDEALPDFVHHFGEKAPPKIFAAAPFPRPTPPPDNDDGCHRPTKVPCGFLRGQTITQKMETPVVYFYADEAQKVSFEVAFPGGIISQSFPAPQISFPEATPGVELKNGFARYDLEVLKETKATAPYVDPSNIYGHARKTRSDLIRIGNEVEHFIFYRGLGEFKTKLLTTSKGGALTLRNQGRDRISAAFLISTDGTKFGNLISLGSIERDESTTIDARRIESLRKTTLQHGDFLQLARLNLNRALVEAGLYKDEAKAMIDTWEHGYFRTPGLRVLYVLGHQEVEEILPVRISPAPQGLERVFVGRIETLLDTQEESLLTEIQERGIGFDTSSLGRMVLPALARVREVAVEKGVLTPRLERDIDFLVKNAK